MCRIITLVPLLFLLTSTVSAQCLKPWCLDPTCIRARFAPRRAVPAAPNTTTVPAAVPAAPDVRTVPAAVPTATTPLPPDMTAKLDALTATLHAAARVSPELEPVATAAESLIDSPIVMSAIAASTGGTGVAAIWAVRAFLAVRRRRREGGDSDSFPQRLPRDQTEARQTLQLRKLEGRDPVLDGFVGVALQDQLAEDIRNGQLPDDVRNYARQLTDQVRDRVDDVAPIATDRIYRGAWRNAGN